MGTALALACQDCGGRPPHPRAPGGAAARAWACLSSPEIRGKGQFSERSRQRAAFVTGARRPGQTPLRTRRHLPKQPVSALLRGRSASPEEPVPLVPPAPEVKPFPTTLTAPSAGPAVARSWVSAARFRSSGGEESGPGRGSHTRGGCWELGKRPLTSSEHKSRRGVIEWCVFKK